ncbi:MAG: hypothetical protein U0S12_04925 [Fimbriimonadales bacterium]
MTKKLLTFGALAVAAVAAYAVIVDGAIGRGVAVNADGVRGRFDFHVRKVVDGDRTRVLGGGTFGISNREDARRLAITFMADRFAVNGTVAEFGGPGLRVVWANGVRREVRGRVSVRVNDRFRDGAGDPDQFAIGFDAPGTEHDTVFRGAVAEGGLSVFHEER